jgi:hypothetical protein
MQVKDAHCAMKAVIGNNTISITWDTQAASKLDNWTYSGTYSMQRATRTVCNIQRATTRRSCSDD